MTMIKTTLRNTLRTTLVLGLAATTLAGTAQARGFGGFHGGGFHGGFSRSIAVGESNPGIPRHGGFSHGWRTGLVSFSPYYECYNRRFIDIFGNVVVRRVCG